MMFKPAARYPVDPRATFMLALSVMSGVSSLAVAEAPNSLQAALPDWAVLIWGVMLIAGAAIALVGMVFKGVGGVITEQVGNMTVAATTTFYATIAIVVVGPAAIFPAGIIGAWGIACFVRWLQLQLLINSAHKQERYHRFIRREIKKARGEQ